MAHFVRELIMQKDASPFINPVDPVLSGCSDYYDIVKEPRDLGTIKLDIESGKYSQVTDILKDINLVWYNCKLYNGSAHPLTQLAEIMQQKYRDAVDTIPQFIFNHSRKLRWTEMLLLPSSVEIFLRNNISPNEIEGNSPNDTSASTDSDILNNDFHIGEGDPALSGSSSSSSSMLNNSGEDTAIHDESEPDHIENTKNNEIQPPEDNTTSSSSSLYSNELETPEDNNNNTKTADDIINKHLSTNSSKDAIDDEHDNNIHVPSPTLLDSDDNEGDNADKHIHHNNTDPSDDSVLNIDSTSRIETTEDNSSNFSNDPLIESNNNDTKESVTYTSNHNSNMESEDIEDKKKTNKQEMQTTEDSLDEKETDNIETTQPLTQLEADDNVHNVTNCDDTDADSHSTDNMNKNNDIDLADDSNTLSKTNPFVSSTSALPPMPTVNDNSSTDSLSQSMTQTITTPHLPLLPSKNTNINNTLSDIPSNNANPNKTFDASSLSMSTPALPCVPVSYPNSLNNNSNNNLHPVPPPVMSTPIAPLPSSTITNTNSLLEDTSPSLPTLALPLLPSHNLPLNTNGSNTNVSKNKTFSLPPPPVFPSLDTNNGTTNNSTRSSLSPLPPVVQTTSKQPPINSDADNEKQLIKNTDSICGNESSRSNSSKDAPTAESTSASHSPSPELTNNTTDNESNETNKSSNNTNNKYTEYTAAPEKNDHTSSMNNTNATNNTTQFSPYSSQDIAMLPLTQETSQTESNSSSQLQSLTGEQIFFVQQTVESFTEDTITKFIDFINNISSGIIHNKNNDGPEEHSEWEFDLADLPYKQQKQVYEFVVNESRQAH